MEAPDNNPPGSNYDNTYGYDRSKYPPVLSPEQFADLVGRKRRLIYALILAGSFRGSCRRRGKRYFMWRDRALSELTHGPLPASKRLLSLDEIQTALQHYDHICSPVCSPEQFAALIDISRATSYAWKANGWFKGVCRRTGKHVFIHRNRAVQSLFNNDEDWYE